MAYPMCPDCADPSNCDCTICDCSNAMHDAPAKAYMPVIAKALDADEEKAWFAGKVPRRILSIPFGGPIPSAKSKIAVDRTAKGFYVAGGGAATTGKALVTLTYSRVPLTP